jgi:integrase
MQYTFSLFPPGSRKKYPFWLAIIRIGREAFEVRTGQKTEAAAKRFAREAGERLVAEAIREQGRALKPGAAISFAAAAEAYLDYRERPTIDEARLAKVCLELGDKMLTEIAMNDLIAAANALLPGRAAATKNREVIRPAASVLHYAADNGACDWLRIKQFKERRPETKAVAPDVANLLIANADDPDLKLLLIWLFHQGSRISEALSVRWDKIDLRAGTVDIYISKVDRWVRNALRPAVVVALANVEDQTGRVFYRWNSRRAVYAVLWPLCARLGVRFTPHMARHSMATWANAAGVPTRTIMEMGNWFDHKAVMRYTGAGVETVRAASAKMPKLAG